MNLNIKINGEKISRARVPHKVHILSWVLSLEKTGSVPCHFKNCTFMAITVEQIAFHFKYAKCVPSPLPFQCDTCKQSTNNINILIYHKIHAHSYQSTKEEFRRLYDYLTEGKREIHPELKRAWQIFHENKKYFKCLQKFCRYTPDTLEELEHHYLNNCKGEFWDSLDYECGNCSGRFLHQWKVEVHQKEVHAFPKVISEGSVIRPPVTLCDLPKYWAESIVNDRQAQCTFEGCKFISNNVSALEKHYRTCNGKQNISLACPTCDHWLLNVDKLTEHMRCIHKINDILICKEGTCDESCIRRRSGTHFILTKTLKIITEMETTQVSKENGSQISDDEWEIGTPVSLKENKDIKTYERRSSRSEENRQNIANTPPPNKPAVIDCKYKIDKSFVQYGDDIVDKNRVLLEELNDEHSILREMLLEGEAGGGGGGEKTKKKPVSKHKPNPDKPYQPILKPSPIEVYAKRIMEADQNPNTVPVQIKVENMDWTVDVPQDVLAKSRNSRFPTNEEELKRALRHQAFIILEKVNLKTSIRADIRKVIDMYHTKLTPFMVSVRKKGTPSSKNSPDEKGDSPGGSSAEKNISSHCSTSVEKNDSPGGTSAEKNISSQGSTSVEKSDSPGVTSAKKNISSHGSTSVEKSYSPGGTSVEKNISSHGSTSVEKSDSPGGTSAENNISSHGSTSVENCISSSDNSSIGKINSSDNTSNLSGNTSVKEGNSSSGNAITKNNNLNEGIIHEISNNEEGNKEMALSKSGTSSNGNLSQPNNAECDSSGNAITIPATSSTVSQSDERICFDNCKSLVEHDTPINDSPKTSIHQPVADEDHEDSVVKAEPHNLTTENDLNELQPEESDVRLNENIPEIKSCELSFVEERESSSYTREENAASPIDDSGDDSVCVLTIEENASSPIDDSGDDSECVLTNEEKSASPIDDSGDDSVFILTNEENAASPIDESGDDSVCVLTSVQNASSSIDDSGDDSECVLTNEENATSPIDDSGHDSECVLTNEETSTVQASLQVSSSVNQHIETGEFLSTPTFQQNEIHFVDNMIEEVDVEEGNEIYILPDDGGEFHSESDSDHSVYDVVTSDNYCNISEPCDDVIIVDVNHQGLIKQEEPETNKDEEEMDESESYASYYANMAHGHLKSCRMYGTPLATNTNLKVTIDTRPTGLVFETRGDGFMGFSHEDVMLSNSNYNRFMSLCHMIGVGFASNSVPNYLNENAAVIYLNENTETIYTSSSSHAIQNNKVIETSLQIADNNKCRNGFDKEWSSFPNEARSNSINTNYDTNVRNTELERSPNEVTSNNYSNTETFIVKEEFSSDKRLTFPAHISQNCVFVVVPDNNDDITQFHNGSLEESDPLSLALNNDEACVGFRDESIIRIEIKQEDTNSEYVLVGSASDSSGDSQSETHKSQVSTIPREKPQLTPVVPQTSRDKITQSKVQQSESPPFKIVSRTYFDFSNPLNNALEDNASYTLFYDPESEPYEGPDRETTSSSTPRLASTQPTIRFENNARENSPHVTNRFLESSLNETNQRRLEVLVDDSSTQSKTDDNELYLLDAEESNRKDVSINFADLHTDYSFFNAYPIADNLEDDKSNILAESNEGLNDTGFKKVYLTTNSENVIQNINKLSDHEPLPVKINSCVSSRTSNRKRPPKGFYKKLNNSLSNISDSIATSSKFNSIFYRSPSAGEEADEEKEEPALMIKSRTKSCDNSLLEDSFKIKDESSDIAECTDVKRARTRSLSGEPVKNTQLSNVINNHDDNEQTTGIKKRGHPWKLANKSGHFSPEHKEGNKVHSLCGKPEIKSKTDNTEVEPLINYEHLSKKKSETPSEPKKRGRPSKSESIKHVLVKKNGLAYFDEKTETFKASETSEINSNTEVELSRNDETLSEKNCETPSEPRKRGRPSKNASTTDVFVKKNRLAYFVEKTELHTSKASEINLKDDTSKVQQNLPEKQAGCSSANKIIHASQETASNSSNNLTQDRRELDKGIYEGGERETSNEMVCSNQTKLRKRGRPPKNIIMQQLSPKKDENICIKSKLDSFLQNESIDEYIITEVVSPASSSFKESPCPASSQRNTQPIHRRRGRPTKNNSTQQTSLEGNGNTSIDSELDSSLQNESIQGVSTEVQPPNCLLLNEPLCSTSTQENTLSIPRKRGRPPKNNTTQQTSLEGNGNTSIDSEPDSSFQNESIQGVSTEVQPPNCLLLNEPLCSTSTQENTLSIPRKRGRPPKNNSTQQTSLEGNGNISIGSEPDSSFQNESIEEGIRTEVRPYDGPLLNEPTCSTSTQGNNQSTARRRGRPPKKNITQQTSFEGDGSITIKSEPDSFFENESTEEGIRTVVQPSDGPLLNEPTCSTSTQGNAQSIPRKRGRPPKKNITQQTSFEVDGSITIKSETDSFFENESTEEGIRTEVQPSDGPLLNEPTCSTSTQGNTQSIPRKRGRPPKKNITQQTSFEGDGSITITSETDSFFENESIEEGIRTEVRPSAQPLLKEPTCPTSTQGNTQSTARRRGRPPKNIFQFPSHGRISTGSEPNHFLQNESIEEDIITKVRPPSFLNIPPRSPSAQESTLFSPRKRGRPPKKNYTQETSLEGDGGITIKSEPESFLDNESFEECISSNVPPPDCPLLNKSPCSTSNQGNTQSIPRKRGRPPKKNITQQTSFESERSITIKSDPGSFFENESIEEGIRTEVRPSDQPLLNEPTCSTSTQGNTQSTARRRGRPPKYIFQFPSHRGISIRSEPNPFLQNESIEEDIITKVRPPSFLNIPPRSPSARESSLFFPRKRGRPPKKNYTQETSLEGDGGITIKSEPESFLDNESFEECISSEVPPLNCSLLNKSPCSTSNQGNTQSIPRKRGRPPKKNITPQTSFEGEGSITIKSDPGSFFENESIEEGVRTDVRPSDRHLFNEPIFSTSTQSTARRRGRPPKNIFQFPSHRRISIRSEPNPFLQNESIEEDIITKVRPPAFLNIPPRSPSARGSTLFFPRKRGRPPKKNYTQETSLEGDGGIIIKSEPGSFLDNESVEDISSEIPPTASSSFNYSPCSASGRMNNQSLPKKRGRPPMKNVTPKLLLETDDNVSIKSEPDSFLDDESFEECDEITPSACSSFISSPWVSSIPGNDRSALNLEKVNGTLEGKNSSLENKNASEVFASSNQQNEIGSVGTLKNMTEIEVRPPSLPRKRGRPPKKKMTSELLIGEKEAASSESNVHMVRPTCSGSILQYKYSDKSLSNEDKTSECNSFEEPANTLNSPSYKLESKLISSNTASNPMESHDVMSTEGPTFFSSSSNKMHSDASASKNDSINETIAGTECLSVSEVKKRGRPPKKSRPWLSNKAATPQINANNVSERNISESVLPNEFSDKCTYNENLASRSSFVESESSLNITKTKNSTSENISEKHNEPSFTQKRGRPKKKSDYEKLSVSSELENQSLTEGGPDSTLDSLKSPKNSIVSESAEVFTSLNVLESTSSLEMDKIQNKKILSSDLSLQKTKIKEVTNRPIEFSSANVTDLILESNKTCRNTIVDNAVKPISTVPRRVGRPPKKIYLKADNNLSKLNSSSDSSHQIFVSGTNLEQPKRKRGRPSRKSIELGPVMNDSSQETAKSDHKEKYLNDFDAHHGSLETNHSQLSVICSEKIANPSLLGKSDDKVLSHALQNNSDEHTKSTFLKSIDLKNNEKDLNVSKESENYNINKISEEALAQCKLNDTSRAELLENMSHVRKTSCLNSEVIDGNNPDSLVLSESIKGPEFTSSVVLPPPKRHGRPKKSVDKSESLMAEISTKNISCGNATIQSNVEPFSPSEKEIGSPRESINSPLDSSIPSSSNDASIIKEAQVTEFNPIVKKRGRPFKIKNISESKTDFPVNVLSDESDSDHVSLPPKIGKGRPKNISECVNSGNDEGIEVDITRGPFPLLSKRKRKPKISLDYIEFSNSIELNSSAFDLGAEKSFEIPPSLPRKRGRPKKVKDTSEIQSIASNNAAGDTTSESTLSTSTPLPRKRGRPRKIVCDVSLPEEFHNKRIMENTKQFFKESRRLFRRLGVSSSPTNVLCDSEKLNHTVGHDLSQPKKRGPGRPRKNPENPSTSRFNLHKFQNSHLLIKKRRSIDSPLAIPRKSDHSPQRNRKRRYSICCMNTIYLENKIINGLKESTLYDDAFQATDETYNSSSRSSVPFRGRGRGGGGWFGRRRKRKEVWDDDLLQEDTNKTEVDGDSSIKTDDAADKSLSSREVRKQKVTGRVDSFTMIRNPYRMVTCAVCNESMPIIDYSRKHLPKHNFMCWLVGEAPLPFDDLIAMTTILNRGKTTFPKHIFRCSECNIAKRSSLGFLSHIQFCGKNDLERENMLVKCEHCSRIMLPASLVSHIYQAHTQNENKALEKLHTRGEVATRQNAQASPSADTSRQAATRCRVKIAEYISKEGPVADSRHKTDPDLDPLLDDDDGLEDLDVADDLRLLYYRVVRRPTKNMKFKWKQNMKRGEAMSCVFPSCSKTFANYDKMLDHHKYCQNGPSSFSCIKCKWICEIEERMREHVKECNPPIALSRSDTSDGEDEDQILSIPLLYKDEVKFGKYVGRTHFIKNAMNYMKTITKTHLSSEPLYEDLSNSDEVWQPLSDQESMKYMPEQKKSLKVSFKGSQKEEMNVFDSNVFKDEGIAFSGGPIWGMAWCPGQGEQYLATSPQLSMESNFQVGSTDTGPAAVHIWALGNIQNSSSSKLEMLKLSFGLCHDEKGVWDMAWCPGGGRTETRLGLLALACVSGSIPIFSIPSPHILNPSGSRHYKPEPMLKLEVYSNEKWQCSAISWSKLKPHRIIVGGFVDGTIAVWDLSNRSKLLCSPCNKIRYPFKIFQAHNSFITGLCLSPESEYYLASSSFDKSFKFWDLKDTTVPRSMTKRGLFTGADWLRHWMMAVSSYDVAYSMSQTSVSFSSIREAATNTLQIISSTNSTAWSVSANDWLNCFAASYDNGQVIVIFATRQVLVNQKDKKRFLNVVLRSSLEEHTDSLSDIPARPSEEGASTALAESSKISLTTYENASKKFGLNIQTNTYVRDVNRTYSNLLRENTSEDPIDVYPLNSINKTCWNPNEQAFSYLAMGYQSGFIVVLKTSYSHFDQCLVDSMSSKQDTSESVTSEQKATDTIPSGENGVTPNPSEQRENYSSNSTDQRAVESNCSEEKLIESNFTEQGVCEQNVIDSNYSHEFHPQNMMDSVSSEGKVVISDCSQSMVSSAGVSRHIDLDSTSSQEKVIHSIHSEGRVNNSNFPQATGYVSSFAKRKPSDRFDPMDVD